MIIQGFLDPNGRGLLIRVIPRKRPPLPPGPPRTPKCTRGDLEKSPLKFPNKKRRGGGGGVI